MTKRVTEFQGQASGDCECFCFDRRKGDHGPFAGSFEEREAARIYPHDLLPEGTRRAYGTWRITIEFTPLSTEHVCGLQGFGALNDVCPACEEREARYREATPKRSEER